MIDPKELKIGNYVTYDNNCPGLEDEGIFTINSITGALPFLNTDKYGIGVVTYANIHPIPITEEWLLKFGLEVNQRKNGTIKTCKIQVLNTGIIHVYLSDPISVELGNISGWSFGYPHVNSIHQLQNLYFALTGEELTIKD